MWSGLSAVLSSHAGWRCTVALTGGEGSTLARAAQVADDSNDFNLVGAVVRAFRAAGVPLPVHEF